VPVQCDVCGRQILGKPHRVIIEGAKMTTCASCAKLGSDRWEPETQKQPIRTGLAGVRSIRLKKRSFVVVQEDRMVAERFGSLVSHAREKLGLSREDLGRRIGEKVSVIKKIENEKMAPDQKLAAKLEHALRIKLVVPIVEPRTIIQAAPPSRGVTLGEVAVLRSGKRRHQKNEGDHSQP